jgi:arylsulfatase A-like enzyme
MKKKFLFISAISLVSLMILIWVGIKWIALTDKKRDHDDRKFNLILITIDTLRVDYLGVYGYPDFISPNIDRLAQSAILFEKAYATAPFTGPSHASLLTSQHPSTHGIIFNGHKAPGKIAKSSVTLSEHLKRNGFATAGVVSAAPLSKKYGFDRGFEYFIRIKPHRRHGEKEKGGAGYKVTQAADKWIKKAAEKWHDSNGEKRFFLWIHYFDPHLPYVCEKNVYQKLKIQTFSPVTQKNIGKKAKNHIYQSYRAEVFETDQQIGELLKFLKDYEVKFNTIVAVAADHGEYLGEKGLFDHSMLYEQVLHVPMFIHIPGLGSCRRKKNVVSTIDLVPTLLDLLSLPQIPTAQGKNLLEEDVSNAAVFAEWRDYNILKNKKKVNANQFLISAQVGETKLIRSIINPKKNLLFNLAADPNEENNLTFKNRTLYKRLNDILNLHIERDLPNGVLESSDIKLDDESIKMLKSLGYIK